MAYTVTYKPILIKNTILIDPRVTQRAQDFVVQFMRDRIADVKPYPPPRPKQRYRRTFRLFTGWFLNIIQNPSAFIVEASNVAHDNKGFYMSKVQGPNQIPLHEQTGWERIDENTVNNRALFKAGLDAIFASAIRRP